MRERRTKKTPIGTEPVTRPPTGPLEAGTNSCTSGDHAVQPQAKSDNETKMARKEARHCPGKLNAGGRLEKFSTVMRKTLRRPILSASQP